MAEEAQSSSSDTSQSSSSAQSSSFSHSQSTSESFIPAYSTTPILEEIARYARAQAPIVYQWGMDQFNRQQGDIDSLLRDALSYASPQRIALNMGMAEAGVMQGAEAGRQAAIRDLQSFGIDPSSGRYAALDQANRVQAAATAAGAGNQQRMADFALGNTMRNQAITAGLQNVQVGYGASKAMNDLLGTAMSLKYPPLGQRSQSTSDSGSQSTQSSQSNRNAQSQSSRSSSPNQQQSRSSTPREPPTSRRVGPQGTPRAPSGQPAVPGRDPQTGAPAWVDPQTGQPIPIDETTGEPIGQDPTYDPTQNPLSSEYDPGEQGGDPGAGWTDPWGGLGLPDANLPDLPWDDGSFDPPFMDSADPWGQLGMPNPNLPDLPQFQYDPLNDPNNPQFDPYEPWNENPPAIDEPPDVPFIGASLDGGSYGGGGDTTSAFTGDTGDSAGGWDWFPALVDDILNGGEDWTSGGNTGYGGGEGEYARGGVVAPTTGGFVSQQLSPSNGARVDDVAANLNAGEFVIPKDVAAWKGQEFFYKLMAQSRKSRATAGNGGDNVGYGAG